ncbi:MAG TPA: hypothetical protein ENJ95_10640 [Bacteroidetes bacterium]|nr:hypothetical protein [Bacteroidota bacterium]
MLESFQNRDFEKVKSVLHYLETEVEDENYLAIYNSEKWLLYLWTGKYNMLFPYFRNLSGNNLTPAFQPFKISPPDDLLSKVLFNKTDEEYESLLSSIDATDLPPPEKEFSKILLKWQLYITGSQKVSEKELNIESNNYLNKFPDSDFFYFTAVFINQEKRLTKGGLAFEFFSGYGLYTGGLKNTFGDHVPFGVAFDYYRNKWVFSFRDHIGFGKLDQDIVQQKGTWKKGEKFNQLIIELSAGREIFDNHRFKIGPFAGVSFTGFEVPTKLSNDRPELKGVKLKYRPVTTLGFNIDIKLNSPYTDNPIWKDGYGIVRLRAGFLPSHFEKKYDGMNGNIFYFTLGLGGVARRVVRKYHYLNK